MCEKVTLKPEKEALEQPEQSRTKPDKNWVIGGHGNKRGRKEMDLSSKQALAEKAKKWMDPSSANYPKDNHTNYKRAGWKWTQKRRRKEKGGGGGGGGKKKHSNAKEPYKSGKTSTQSH